MVKDLPHPAAADTEAEPTAKANLEAELPRPHGNTKHALRSNRPIIRALLPEDEAACTQARPSRHVGTGVADSRVTTIILAEQFLSPIALAGLGMTESELSNPSRGQ